MKKDRNCGAQPYPVPMMNNYQGAIPVPMMQPGIQPIMQPGIMGGVPMMPGMYPNAQSGVTSNNTGSMNQMVSSLQSQVKDLERRVTTLENVMNGSNYSSNYNTSNYQMM